MINIDKSKAKDILTNELGYDDIGADLFLKDYPLLFDPLAKTVEHWFEDRTVENFETLGITIKDIMKVNKYNFLIALKDMNLLLDPNAPQEKKERMAKHLKRPTPIA